MKVWTKVKITKKDKELEQIVTSYINYIFKDTAFSYLAKKYQMTEYDVQIFYQKLAARIAGVLLLYLADDKKRLQDILNKYSQENVYLKDLIPEVEGYIDR